MKNLIFKRKKQFITVGILIALSTLSFNLGGQEINTRDPEVFLTPLETGWNLLSLRYDANLYKENLSVRYNTIDYTWTDAVSAGIIDNNLFKWDAAVQYYPSWMEIVVTLAVIFTEIYIFRWVIKRMPVLRESPSWVKDK